MNQKRQPNGIPTGGQYAESAHDEASSGLEMSDEEYNKTGTFLYPPYPRSAKQLIAFYENCDPNEEQLTKFADAYGSARLRWAAPLIERADERFKGIHGAGTKAASDAHWGFVAELESEHPTHLNPLFARDISRAVQMARFAPALDDRELVKVQRHRIVMKNGQSFTVQELADRYLSTEYDGDLV